MPRELRDLRRSGTANRLARYSREDNRGFGRVTFRHYRARGLALAQCCIRGPAIVGYPAAPPSRSHRLPSRKRYRRQVQLNRRM